MALRAPPLTATDGGGEAALPHRQEFVTLLAQLRAVGVMSQCRVEESVRIGGRGVDGFAQAGCWYLPSGRGRVGAGMLGAPRSQLHPGDVAVDVAVRVERVY